MNVSSHIKDNTWRLSISTLLLGLIFWQPAFGQNKPEVLDSLKKSILISNGESLAPLYFEVAEIYRTSKNNADSLDHYLNMALAASRTFKNEIIEVRVLKTQASIAGRKGNNHDSEEWYNLAVNKARDLSDTLLMADVLYSKAVYAQRKGDQISFVSDMLEAVDYYDSLREWNKKGMALISLGIQYAGMDNLDMALETLHKAEELKQYFSARINSYLLLNLGKNYRRKFQKNGDKTMLNASVKILEDGVAIADMEQDKTFMGDFRLALLDTYQQLEKPVYRHDYADDVIQLGLEEKDGFLLYQGHLAHAQMYMSQSLPSRALNHRSAMKKAVSNLSNPVYHRSFHQVNYEISKSLGRHQEALNYLEEFKTINDSLLSVERSAQYNEILEKYEREKKEQEIAALTKDKKNLAVENELKAAQLRSRNFMLFSLAFITLLSIGLIYFYLRQKWQQEKTKTIEMEQQLLRAQMNPHFLFNALNGIKRFYVEGHMEKANDFLADFGSFLRTILERSRKTHIHILDEISFLKLYLDLENRRLDGGLSYRLKYNEDDFEFDDVIPSFILQPLIENSVWHGIMNSERDGEIFVSFAKNGDTIFCEIKDNGIGYFTSINTKKKKHQSRGLTLIKERLGNKGNIVIEEIKNAIGEVEGTKVLLSYNAD
jgi:hypothetical protein